MLLEDISMQLDKNGVCTCFDVHTYEMYDPNWLNFRNTKIKYYRCLATPEQDECTCMGDPNKCNFYPEEAKRYTKIHECDFCNNFDFSRAACEVEKTDTYVHANISFAGGHSRFNEDKQFKFCPMCGRALR